MTAVLTGSDKRSKKMELVIDETRTKELIKQAIIELMQERRDVVYEIIVEAMEEIGLANAIREGRRDEWVSEAEIQTILEEQA